MAEYDPKRYQYALYLKDYNLWARFYAWCESKGHRENHQFLKSEYHLMSMFLVHLGVRNDLVGNPRYDNNCPEDQKQKARSDYGDKTAYDIAKENWL